MNHPRRDRHNVIVIAGNEIEGVIESFYYVAGDIRMEIKSFPLGMNANVGGVFVVFHRLCGHDG
jgi:hypothetical protein